MEVYFNPYYVCLLCLVVPIFEGHILLSMSTMMDSSSSSSSRMSGLSRKAKIVIAASVAFAGASYYGTPLAAVDYTKYDAISWKAEVATAATANTLSPPGARLAFDQHGSWMGNMWIPPKGWSTFSALDMLELYKHKRILWLGDSTARRGAMTMYAIINSTASKNYNSTSTSQTQFHPTTTELDHKSVLDINKKTDPTARQELCSMPELQVKRYRPSICRHMPANGAGLLIMTEGITCVNRFKYFLNHLSMDKNNLIQMADPDVIIVSIGVWEIRFPEICKVYEENMTIQDRVYSMIDRLEDFQRNTSKTIVVRTGNYVMGAPDGDGANRTRALNQHTMERINGHRRNDTRPAYEPRLTYVDWGGAIEPRAVGSARINGDMVAHMGLEPRLTLMQMLTNHLYDIGVFTSKR
jgi:hypothetical protein